MICCEWGSSEILHNPQLEIHVSQGRPSHAGEYSSGPGCWSRWECIWNHQATPDLVLVFSALFLLPSDDHGVLDRDMEMKHRVHSMRPLSIRMTWWEHSVVASGKKILSSLKTNLWWNSSNTASCGEIHWKNGFLLCLSSLSGECRQSGSFFLRVLVGEVPQWKVPLAPVWGCWLCRYQDNLHSPAPALPGADWEVSPVLYLDLLSNPEHVK